ncbi:MAG: aminopeptidase P family protein, partial [Victivallales bacterium]|nr:aminopeptidase P family protein [Victivallales bacterium]
MGYLIDSEAQVRLANVRAIMEKENLDIALVYYDESNIGNGWYLTGWCPQFESGAVLIPRKGTPMLLGGPESEPFAKQDSAIKETRNFPVFMVPDEEYPAATIIDFPKLFAELRQTVGEIRRIGLVGAGRMPYECYKGLEDGFVGATFVDITDPFLNLRYHKSKWEIEQIRAAFQLADGCYDAMKAAIKPGASEIEVAAAGEYAARSKGATGFGFVPIVGSGIRSNAVVPTATTKIMPAG